MNIFKICSTKTGTLKNRLLIYKIENSGINPTYFMYAPAIYPCIPKSKILNNTFYADTTMEMYLDEIIL